jgi:hypothetical protein
MVLEQAIKKIGIEKKRKIRKVFFKGIFIEIRL